ncbi:MAG: hypothetical protein HY675_20070 [Chloroflexi bacterium]|nr:hypothetical protein [Chloroflexota bacterium]
MTREVTILGDETLTEVEGKVLSIYQDLKDLLRRPDLSPCVLFNARQALADMYPIVNDLGLLHEHLIDDYEV